MICTPPVLNQQPMYHNHLNHNQQLHYPVQQLHDQQPQRQHQHQQQQQQQQQQQSLPQLQQPPQPQQQPQPQAPQHPQHQQVAYLSDQNQQQQQQFAQQQDDDFQRYNNMRFEHLQQQIVELHTLLEQQQQVISYMQQQMSQEHLKLYDYIANVTGTNNNNNTATATATAAAATAAATTTTTTTNNNNNNDNKSNSTSAPSNNSFINTNSPNKFRNNSVVGINGFNQVNIPPINLNNMASPTAEYNGGVNIHTPGGSISNNNNTAVNTTNTASSNNSTNNNAVHRNGSLSYIASTTSLLNHHQPPPQALTPSATNNNNSQNYQIPNHPHNTNNSSFNNNGINASGSMSQLNIHRNAISSNDSYNNTFGYLSNNGISNGINGFSNLQNTTSQFLKNATLAGSQSNIHNSNSNSNNNNNNNISASVFNNGNNTNNTINSRFAAGINNNNSNIGIHGQINNSSGDNYLVKAANVATNHHTNSLSDSDHKNSISDNDSSKNGNSVSMSKDDSYKHSLNLITSTNNNDSDDELARNSHNNNKNSNPTTITTSNSLTNDIDNSDSDAHQHGSDTKKTAFLSPVKANVKGTLTDTNMHISNSASSRNMGHGLNMEQENEDNANAEGEMDDEEDNEILDKEITTNNTVVEDEESKLGTRGNETKSLGTRALQKSKGYDAPSAERSNSLDYQELLAHHPELAQFDWNPCVSVLQIYQRFYHGLGNTPSVIEMEEKYGTIWRSQKCKLTLETSRVIAREFTIIKLVDLVNKVVLSILMSDGSEKNFTIDDAINVTQQYFNKVLTREPKLRNMSDHIRTTKIFANFDMVASKFSNLRFAENKLEIAKNYSSVTMKKYRWHLGGI
ncbi:hypothetical protein ACO0QE_002051 [Hanseniaspora vineae]